MVLRTTPRPRPRPRPRLSTPSEVRRFRRLGGSSFPQLVPLCCPARIVGNAAIPLLMAIHNHTYS